MIASPDQQGLSCFCEYDHRVRRMALLGRTQLRGTRYTLSSASCLKIMIFCLHSLPNVQSSREPPAVNLISEGALCLQRPASDSPALRLYIVLFRYGQAQSFQPGVPFILAYLSIHCILEYWQRASPLQHYYSRLFKLAGTCIRTRSLQLYS